MTRAALGLISDGQGKYLSVSRKDNPNDKGFPGGKVNMMIETDEMGTAREVLEETGLVVNPDMLLSIYDGLDCNGCSVVTFLVAEWSGEVHTEEEGVVEWLWPWEFLTDNNTYCKYNWQVFRRLGIVP